MKNLEGDAERLKEKREGEKRGNGREWVTGRE